MLYTHGAPAHMCMLRAALREEEKKEAWQAYAAQMLWYANHAAYSRMGKPFEHPTWLDMMHPQARDERSGNEIVRDVARTMRERMEKKAKTERRE